MVLNFGKLTAEEEILKEKINKYKKKKKTLAAQKAPKPEKPENVDNQKNPETSTDEQARILKKLNAMKQEKAKKDKKYKRSKSVKTPNTEQALTFHRFSQAENETTETSTSKTPDPSRKFDLYNSFVPSSERPEGKREQRTPKKGNTIFVQGAVLSRNSLSSCFERFGAVVNISLESEKNRAFITYEHVDSALEAIKQMNESLLDEVQLRVDMARRQPPVDSFRETNPPPEERSAPSGGRKASTDDRELVKYEDPFL